MRVKSIFWWIKLVRNLVLWFVLGQDSFFSIRLPLKYPIEGDLNTKHRTGYNFSNSIDLLEGDLNITIIKLYNFVVSIK